MKMHALSTLLISLTLCSCAAYHRQHRDNFATTTLASKANQNDLTAHQERKDRVMEVYGQKLRIAHVECDDQGGFWESATLKKSAPGGLKKEMNQLDFLEQEIRHELKMQPTLYRQGAVIITYVHGWNHNGREGNGNLMEFRKALSSMSAAEQAGMNRPVIGVYLSWRGRPLATPSVPAVDEYAGLPTLLGGLPHTLSFWTTFWNRKATAEKVGYRAVAEALKRLSLLRGEIEEVEPAPSNQKKSRLIVVGHSFGATAVFSAVSRFFEDDLIELSASAKRRKEDTYIRRHWDLVVLVNPAFEALRFVTIATYSRDKRLQELAREIKKPYLLLPRFMVVQSENDGPNKWIFPIGQWAGNATVSTQSTKRIDQSRRLHKSLGFYEDFSTHELVLSDCSECPAQMKSRIITDKEKSLDRISAHEALRLSHGGTRHARIAEVFESTKAVADGHGGSIGPVMVAKADKAVVDGHNGIWGRNFIGFFVQLLHAREKAVLASARE